MKKMIGIIGIALIAGGVALPAVAADLRFPETEGGGVNIRTGEVFENLYVGGASVVVEGDVEKGLYAGGGSVLVTGNVGQDAHLGGGTVNLRGSVGGTVHIGGGQVVVEGPIGDDLFVGGGTVYIASTATIGGSLYIGAGTVILDAPVEGDVYLGAGEATVNARVGGSIEGDVERLTLGAGANVEGDMIYTADEEARVHADARVLGETRFDERVASPKRVGEYAGFAIIFTLLQLVGSIVAGLVLIYPLRRFSVPILTRGLTNIWPSVGIGMTGLIVIPMIAVVIALSIIGLIVTGLIGITYLCVLAYALVLSSVAFGSWFIKTVTQSDAYLFRWQEVVVGAVLLAILNLIPFIGWIPSLIFVALCFGAMLRLIQKKVLA